MKDSRKIKILQQHIAHLEIRLSSLEDALNSLLNNNTDTTIIGPGLWSPDQDSIHADQAVDWIIAQEGRSIDPSRENND